MEKDSIDLDNILVDLGQFGKFQKKNYFLICLVIIFSIFPMSFIFTTRHSDYRCKINECDETEEKYETEWVKYAIPSEKDGSPKECERYVSQNISISSDTCTQDYFNSSNIISCDSFIFLDPEATIEKDFNVTCDENMWKLTIVGTINCIGELVCLPLSGYVSDRYGRRTMMIISVLLSTVAGLLKSMTPNYISYVVMEFLDTSLGSGSYSAAFILAIELVVPEQRVFGNTLLSCAFALGEVFLGVVAWISTSWRFMLRFLYAPGIFFISYYWFSNESVRWLISKGHHEEAKVILKKVAKQNGTVLSDEVIQKLSIREEKSEKSDSLLHILKAPVLIGRLVNCSFGWICCTFVYYGLTMHSVSITGNIYVNFIMVAFIEIPAFLASYYVLDKIGRKLSLSISLLLSGAACIAFVFIPEANSSFRLILFLIGKFTVTIAYTTLYIYTTEMFPTNLRHSLLAVCSMFGRLGSMVAPQVPLLARISKTLPIIMFGIMATTSGLLALLFPETLNKKLPDNIHEAIHIDKKTVETA